MPRWAPAMDPAVRDVDWAGVIVLCAATNWDGVKLADHHLAEHLTAHAPVLYVDQPMSHLTRLKNPAAAASTSRPHLRMVGERIGRYTPLVAPKPTAPWMAPVTTQIVRQELRHVLRRLGTRAHAVVTTWLFIDAYGSCGEDRRVYWWSDDPVGAAEHWNADARRLRSAEERLARASDLVVAVNDGAVQRWRERGVAAEHVPNGCDAAFLEGVDAAPDPTDVPLTGPIAGFVGHINSRTDLALLEAIAADGTSLLLVGPKDPGFEPERFDRLVAQPNVCHVGPKPFGELLPYLKIMDVGLVPYGHTEFNRWSFPLKTLEYLAAGRGVVSTSLPAAHWLGTGLVTLADHPDDFAAAVRRECAVVRDDALVARRRAFAAGHSWAQRAADFAKILGIGEKPATSGAAHTNAAHRPPMSV